MPDSRGDFLYGILVGIGGCGMFVLWKVPEALRRLVGWFKEQGREDRLPASWKPDPRTITKD
jgi:hypothetical protein